MYHKPCQTLGRSQNKEPAIPMEIPSRPWKTIGVDLLLQDSKWYTIVADYYLRYPWICQLHATASKRATVHSQRIPRICISIWIHADHKSPYHSKSHGFIERQVQTIKNLLSKCAKDGSDHHLTLTLLRSTPLESRTTSPGKLL